MSRFSFFKLNLIIFPKQLEVTASKAAVVFCCALVSCLLPFHAFGLRSDRDQPIKMSSDQADLNDVTQEYVLTGNVILIKGSLRIEGDKAVVLVDPEGYQKISVIAPPNQLAKFNQRLDGSGNENTEGYGDLIFYDEKKEQLLIKGNALAKKRSGTKLLDQIEADAIEYALDTEKYRATNSPSKNRVRTIISPSREQETVKLTDQKKL